MAGAAVQLLATYHKPLQERAAQPGGRSLVCNMGTPLHTKTSGMAGMASIAALRGGAPQSARKAAFSK